MPNFDGPFGLTSITLLMEKFVGPLSWERSIGSTVMVVRDARREVVADAYWRGSTAEEAPAGQFLLDFIAARGEG